jgi:uncharacterized protein (TIGR02466 family)
MAEETQIVQHAVDVFKVVVWAYEIPDPVPLNRRLEDEITALQKSGNTNTERTHTWQSTPNLHLLKSPAFSELTGRIEEAIGQVAETHQWVIQGFDFTGMWANILEPGEMIDPHSHQNNILSGVYHLKGDPKELSHRIVFLSPMAGTNSFVPKSNRHGFDLVQTGHNSIYFFPCIPGTLLLFPSWLRHYVPTNRGESRMSISFNLIFRGEMGHDASTLAWSII